MWSFGQANKTLETKYIWAQLKTERPGLYVKKTKLPFILCSNYYNIIKIQGQRPRAKEVKEAKDTRTHQSTHTHTIYMYIY